MARKPTCLCGVCRKCKNREYQREWSRRNGHPKYYSNPDLKLQHYLKKLYRIYGITPEVYAEMFTAQNGRCAICKEPETSRGNGGEIKRLAVDHNHVTGEVRGLLCNNCNRALGLLKDDRSVVQATLDYLDRFEY